MFILLYSQLLIVYGWTNVTYLKLNLKGIKHRYCTRLITHDEEIHDNRLSILKLSELNIHLQTLCFHFVSKYNLMKIINAVNTSLNNNPLIEPPSSTIMFSISSLESFLAIFN